MATNTNTSSETILSSDIYEIADFYDQIRRDNIPDIDDTASMVGIFGYMNEMFSQTMQNTLIVVSETTNETIATRAKFSKNVIAHALNFGITDINAKPAVMTLMIYLPISYLENNFTELNTTTGKAKFILSSKVPICIDKFEFHLDYDVIISRTKNVNDQFVYTAMYDLFETGTTNVKQYNPLSDIYNPYITTIFQANINNVDYVAFSARLHQVRYITINKNILTQNSIENKTITFEFDDQLASFDVDVVENGKVMHLTPIYNGLLDYTIENKLWCYYEYINSNTIRILFSKDSYVPPLNSEVIINVYLSDGASGNFTYNQPFRTPLICEEYNNYNGMYALIYPLLNGVSGGGKDKKSIADLKKIIPREASSRGAIINTTDLQNFFNSINDTECKLFFKKKRDNPFERIYYAYMLMKKNGNVYPTNTINLKIKQSDFVGHSGNNNLSINPGTIFYYYNHGSDEENDYATLTPPEYIDPDNDDITYPVTKNKDGDYVRVYEYISPFLITIDDDLITSYLLTIMNENKTFKFDSINTASDLQFVATNMQWIRNFYYTGEDKSESIYDNRYTMTVDIAQNNMINYGLIKSHIDADGNTIFDDVRVKMYIVFYSDDTATIPYRYAEAQIAGYDSSRYIYTFKFTFETDDLMDLNNRINIKGVYNAKPEDLQILSQTQNAHGYMNKNTYAKIYILADFGTKPGDIINNTLINETTAEAIIYGEDGIGNRTEIESIIPSKQDVIDQFLNNDIYINIDNSQLNVVSIIKSKPTYLNEVKRYNGDDKETSTAILRYLRNNKNSDFVQNVLLEDRDVKSVIESYLYEDLSRYTLCNVMSVDGGIDFYHDYSSMMRSDAAVKRIPKLDDDGNQLYKEIKRRSCDLTPQLNDDLTPKLDSNGNQLYDEINEKQYSELVPLYLTNDDGVPYYNYTLTRLPVIKSGYLNSEELIQDFIYELEERRKYISECLHVLEDTFDIDFKFVNTFGPSKTFYYRIPSSQNYKAIISVKELNVYSTTVNELDETAVIGKLKLGQQITILKTKGQWGKISLSSDVEGWIKLSDTIRKTNFVDNVAVHLKFALEAQTSADRGIGDGIAQDIKEYIEDINEINELHIPNIITLITNNYREQLVYFEFLDVNNYGSSCQHLYLYERDKDIADIAPEFINVATSEDNKFQPMIDIIVY